MKTSIRAFSPLDVAEFIPLEGVFGGDAKKRTVDSYLCGAYVYTLFDDHGVVGVGGCTPLWDGVAETWSLLGDGIYRNPKDFSLRSAELINYFIDMLNLFRLQANVTVGHTAAIKWIERFGFVREGLMKNYHKKGSDCYLYARYV